MRYIFAFGAISLLIGPTNIHAQERWSVPAEADALFASGDGEAAFAMTLPLLFECEQKAPLGEACFDLFLATSEFSLRAPNRLPEGEAVARRGLALAQKLSAEPTLAQAGMQNNLAQTLDQQQRFDEARALYRAAIGTYSAILGPSDPFTRLVMVNLERNLRQSFVTSRNPDLFAQMIDLQKSMADADPGKLFTLGIETTNSLLNAGVFREAEPIARQTLALAMEKFGTTSLETAEALMLLATLLGALERYDEAEKILSRSIALFRANSPEDHRSIGSALQQLAIIVGEKNDLLRKEQLLLEALDEIERALVQKAQVIGTADETMAAANSAEYIYAVILDGLGTIMQDRYRYGEAERYFRAAVDQAMRVLGENDYYVAFRLNNLGALYFTTQKYAEARDTYAGALEICQSNLGPNHPDCATIEMNLAVALSELKQTGEAERRLFRVAEIRRAAFGERSLLYAIASANLADAMSVNGKKEEAATLYRSIAALVDATFQADLPERIKILWYAANFARTGDFANGPYARTLYRKAIAGIVQRKAAGDFGADAQADFRNHRPLFVNHVKNSWALGEAAVLAE